MTNRFEVEPDRLRAAAHRVRTTGDELSDELRRVRQVVDELGTQWRGPSAEHFDELLRRWGREAERLRESLSAIADLVDRSAGAHVETVDQQNSRLRDLDPILNPGQHGEDGKP